MLELDDLLERRKKLDMEMLKPKGQLNAGKKVDEVQVSRRPEISYMQELGFKLIGREEIKEKIINQLLGCVTGKTESSLCSLWEWVVLPKQSITMKE